MRILILCLLVGTAAAFVSVTKNKEPTPGRYIVKLKEGVETSRLLDTLSSECGVEIFHKYEMVFNGFTATLPEDLMLMIQKSEIVEFIEEDGLVDMEAVRSWGLDRIDQRNLPLDDSFHPIGDGEGVTIYVIDSGINHLHDEFEGRNLEFYSVVGGDGEDCGGHGTHCSAIAAGNTYGVARKANIVSIRCMPRTGDGHVSDVVAAMEWVVTNAKTPAVVSMSLSSSISEGMDEAAKAVSKKSGILMVVAAGNQENNACDRSPGRVSSVLTVGATDRKDSMAFFSNYGSCIDIMAPGFRITSAWIRERNAAKTLSGTSMATAHVAGTAAVLLAQNINQTPNELKANIIEKATAGVLQAPLAGSPNLLVYVGEGSVPTESPPPTGRVKSNCSGKDCNSDTSFPTGRIEF